MAAPDSAETAGAPDSAESVATAEPDSLETVGAAAPDSEERAVTAAPDSGDIRGCGTRQVGSAHATPQTCVLGPVLYPKLTLKVPQRVLKYLFT